MDCATCGGNCCKAAPILIPTDQAKAVIKKYPEMAISFEAFAFWSILKSPCGFLKEGQCSIHDDPVRPLICAQFPLKSGTGIQFDKRWCPPGRLETVTVMDITVMDEARQVNQTQSNAAAFNWLQKLMKIHKNGHKVDLMLEKEIKKVNARCYELGAKADTIEFKWI